MLSKNFNSKRVFKEKIVQLYIGVIKGEEPLESNQNFWGEFFLLKANSNALEQELSKIENISDTKNVISTLFAKSLESIKDSNQLRITNGLITICSLAHHVLYTLRSNFKQEEVFMVLFGQENFSNVIEEFVGSLCELLFSEIHLGIKGIVLKLLLLFATAYKDLNDNLFLEYLMSYQIFDALIDLLNCHLHDDCKILLLLVVFLSYKKPNTNPYIMKLSIVDNEVILSGYSQVILNELIKFNKNFEHLCKESKSGIFSTLSSMVGTIFSSDENNVNLFGVLGKKSSFQTLNTVLLAFYEAVSLNRNFISLLTTSPSEIFLLKNEENSSDINYSSHSFPPNLLVAFLEFSSIVMLGTKGLQNEVASQTTRLCFIIMTCITEDPCANSIIHDNNMAFIVNLQKMPMRHRKVSNVKTNVIRPISHVLLDLMVEFILTHINRNIPYDLYMFCLGIIHRLLCFQKRCRIRIDYNWKELWSALILLIKFFINNEAYLLKHNFNIFQMAQHIINIFNFFIMHGDSYLASVVFHDELYYEIIRMHTIFDNLNSLALRHMTKENQDFKDAARKLTNAMINIKAIIAHFNAKIEVYSQQNQLVTLSEEQLLQVFRDNYDSLTLKLQDSLDQFEPYNSDKQTEIDFFTGVISSIIEDYSMSKPLTVSFDEQQILVQEIQSNSVLNSAVSENETALE